MTKESYFEMCEMLNSEPIEAEIPIDFEDLHLDVQEAYSMYVMLQDNWDTMNGTYIGKNYSGLLDILELFEIDDKKTTFTLIRKIDEYRSKSIAAKKPKNAS